MKKKAISGGVVHDLPEDVEQRIMKDKLVHENWEDITPLARNEWICWVEDAKKADTRNKRIDRLLEDLKNGKRRPCCWPGCAHREKNTR
ncbi:MAG: YdeI/OmpD-associated family protein [Gammaproteobacteria bacterium]|nr:YdeI/OmpD-associated family protein [Gammaproteobacteria bacterium]